MSRTTQGLVHLALIALQGAPLVWPHMIPAGHEIQYAGFLATLNAAIGMWAQGSNTDGTPQSMPFVPEKK